MRDKGKLAHGLCSITHIGLNTQGTNVSPFSRLVPAVNHAPGCLGPFCGIKLAGVWDPLDQVLHPPLVSHIEVNLFLAKREYASHRIGVSHAVKAFSITQLPSDNGSHRFVSDLLCCAISFHSPRCCGDAREGSVHAGGDSSQVERGDLE